MPNIQTTGHQYQIPYDNDNNVCSSATPSESCSSTSGMKRNEKQAAALVNGLLGKTPMPLSNQEQKKRKMMKPRGREYWTVLTEKYNGSERDSDKTSDGQIKSKIRKMMVVYKDTKPKRISSLRYF